MPVPCCLIWLDYNPLRLEHLGSHKSMVVGGASRALSSSNQLVRALMERSQPKSHDHQPTLPTHLTGVRTVAFFEACKGLIVLAVGFGVFRLIHHDVAEWADNVVYHLHLDPDRRLARAFLQVADGMTDR